MNFLLDIAKEAIGAGLALLILIGIGCLITCVTTKPADRSE